jgi:methionyl-tRNA formyltransferase
MFNIHSGELPTYRGLMAAWRAMCAGDEFIQPSLHLIPDAGIDTGPLLGMGKFRIDKSK